MASQTREARISRCLWTLGKQGIPFLVSVGEEDSNLGRFVSFGV